MICVICRQAEAIDGRISVTLERGECKLLVSSIPGRVCPGCGEAYLDELTVEQLLRIANETSESGMLDAHFEYDTL